MQFTGQYAVAICDIECNALFRLYYPTNTPSFSAWTEKPYIYSHGLMRYLRLPLLTPLAALWLWKRTIPCHKDAEPLQQSFPLIIFSHGLHGNRLIYSHLCGELASHGFIVAAIEHRDGSASVAALNGHATHVFYEIPASLEDDFHWDYRRKQLDVRFQEVKNTLEAIQDLNEGCPIMNDMPCQLNLQCFKNKIRLNEMILMGHSFGAATTLEVLQKSHSFKCGILLDPWMWPVPITPIHVPLLCIQSEKFHWGDNWNQVKEQLSKAPSHPTTTFVIVRNTHHADFSDVEFLYPSPLKLLRKESPLDPNALFPLCRKLCTEFIEQCIQNIHLARGLSDETLCHEHLLYGEEAHSHVHVYINTGDNNKRPH